MPPQRCPLGPISGNTIKKKELTPYKRGQIVSASIAGLDNPTIATTLKDPWINCLNHPTLRLTPFERRGLYNVPAGDKFRMSITYVVLVRLVRTQPKLTYKEVRKELGWTYSDSTLKRMLEPSGIRNWRAKRRPHLTEVHAKKRYDWCKARLNWTLAEWRKYM